MNQDDQKGLFDEIDRVALLSKSDRLAWLLRMRDQFAEHPNREEVLRSFESLLENRIHAARLRVESAHVFEVFEAEVFKRLETLISLSADEIPDDDGFVLDVARLAVFSLLSEPLRARCQEPDAKITLDLILSHLIARARPGGSVRTDDRPQQFDS